jgi:hypothetical protein
MLLSKKLRIVVSGHLPQDTEDVLNLRNKLQLPHGVLIAEQFVTTHKHPDSSRILTYRADLLDKELARLKSLGMITGDSNELILRNNEHGHPLDGTPTEIACRTWASDLKTRMPNSRRAAYGLLKRNFYGSKLVPCAKSPFVMDVVDGDRVSRRTFDFDTDVVAELYLPHPLEKFGSSIQRSWMIDIVGRTVASTNNGLRGAIGLVLPWYARSWAAGEKPIELSNEDLFIVLEAAQHLDELAIWAHVGQTRDGVTIEELHRQIDKWQAMLA